MNKRAVLGGFCVAILVVVAAHFLRLRWNENPENDPNYFLNRELQHFYPDASHSFASSYWSPSIEKRGLTYSFDAIVVLKEKQFNSAQETERTFSKVFSDYQKKLNSIPHIRPFLANFPLPANDLSLSVRFVDDRGEHMLPPYMECVHSDLNDKLMFAMYHPNFQWHFQRVMEKKFSASTLLKPFLSPAVERSPPPTKEIKIPVFKNAPSDPPFWKSMGSFMVAFAKQHRLFPLSLIPVGEDYYDAVSFGFAVWGKEKVAFHEAHLMGAQCARDFLNFIQKDKACKKFMLWRSKDRHFKDPATIPEPRHFAFRISFWDEAINRQPSPFIAEIRYDQSVFKYFTSDEGQRLVLVHEESFDEAMKFLEQANKKDLTMEREHKKSQKQS